MNFKTVSRTIRVSSPNFTPIYNIEFLKDDFKSLNKLDISINTGRNDLNEYLKIINEEIAKRIDTAKDFLPEWINFESV